MADIKADRQDVLRLTRCARSSLLDTELRNASPHRDAVRQITRIGGPHQRPGREAVAGMGIALGKQDHWFDMEKASQEAHT